MKSVNTDSSDQRPVPTPTCPTCGSRQVLTTSKVVTAASYWRCESCGDVWNVERQRQGSRYVPSPWR